MVRCTCREFINLKYSYKNENEREKDSNPKPLKSSENKPKRKITRLQDSRIMEMYDSGTCLTMHQPWASLLIKGIKIHEGRVWNSNFRGRLWIHSSSKAPDEDLIKGEFNFYLNFFSLKA